MALEDTGPKHPQEGVHEWIIQMQENVRDPKPHSKLLLHFVRTSWGPKPWSARNQWQVRPSLAGQPKTGIIQNADGLLRWKHSTARLVYQASSQHQNGETKQSNSPSTSKCSKHAGISSLGRSIRLVSHLHRNQMRMTTGQQRQPVLKRTNQQCPLAS